LGDDHLGSPGLKAMPLRDHFHPPWSEHNPWEGFHSAWVNTMVRDLNGSLLPPGFRALPQVHLGPFVETDLATVEEEGRPADSAAEPKEGSEGNGTAVWAPPAVVQTLEVEFPAQDVFEVRVYSDQRGMRLAAVVELVMGGGGQVADHAVMADEPASCPSGSREELRGNLPGVADRLKAAAPELSGVPAPHHRTCSSGFFSSNTLVLTWRMIRPSWWATLRAIASAVA
jgi:hypothetical protein